MADRLCHAAFFLCALVARFGAVMKSTMTNKSKPSSNPSSVRRLLLLPLGLAILLIAADVISQSQLQSWLLNRMEVADSWLLSIFTADIDRSSAARDAIPPQDDTAVTNAPARLVEMQLMAPESSEASTLPQQSAAASFMNPDDLDAPSTAKWKAADEMLRQAVDHSAADSGNPQICRVVLAGTAVTGSRQPDGTWVLQQGALQQNMVIPDSTGALHPAGRLDANSAPELDQSAAACGTLLLEPREQSMAIIWTAALGVPDARHVLHARFVSGTLADLQQGLPVELEPEKASAPLLQNLLAERLCPLLARRLGDLLEAKDIVAELATPGSTRIRIEKDELVWSFRSAATVRLKRLPARATF